MASNLKVQRATSKRLFTRAKKSLTSALNDEDDVEIIEDKFQNFRVRWSNVQDKHEAYISGTQKEGEPISEEDEEWITQIEAEYKECERSKVKYIRSTTIKTEEVLKEDAFKLTLEVEDNKRMDQFRNLRKLEEVTFLNDVDYLTELVDAAAAVSAVVEAQKEMKEQYEKCKSAQSNLISILDQQGASAEWQWMKIIQKPYSDINRKIGKFLESKKGDIEKGGTKSPQPKTGGIRLERMKMPSFDGEIRDYPRFKSDFKKQVMPEMKSVDSAAYVLRSCLQGKPLEIVKNIDDNLSEMWRRLDERYGSPSRLADVVMNDIKKLKVVPEGDDKKFIALVDTVERGYLDLARVNIEREISNTTTVSLIEERLPRDIRRLWSLLVNKANSTVDKFDKFPSLLEFLLEQKRGIEYEYSELRGNERLNALSYHLNVTDKDDSANGIDGCWIHKNDNHTISSCRYYTGRSPEERIQLIKTNYACWSCLRTGHRSSECSHKVKCNIDNCGKYHHVSLHEAHVKGLQFHYQGQNGVNVTCLLQLMRIQCGTPQVAYVNTLWDGGATLSLITFKKAKELHLTGRRIRLSVIKVGGVQEDIDSYAYDLPLCDKDGTVVNFSVYGIKCITSALESIEIGGVVKLFPDVAENHVVRPKGEVDVLIGFEYAGFHPVRVQSSDHLLLLQNRFGLCIGGSHPSINERTHKVIRTVQIQYISRVTIEDFFQTEAMGIECTPKCGGCKCGHCPIGGKQFSLKEERELAQIERGLVFEDGRWNATYPWIRSPSELPNNRNAALGMLKSQEQRLLKNKEYAETYHNQIVNMIERNVARKLTRTELEGYTGPVFYIGHHDVLKPDSESTPCRLVFNSSQKFGEHILNEYWAKGPSLLNNLLGILLRFREGWVAITGDIKKMYHTVKISEIDQHTHRFLWRDLEVHRVPDEYVMTSVSFGDKPAGTIAIVALQNTAKMGKAEYPKAAEIIINNTYVDDVIDSLDDVDEAISVTQDMDALLSKGGFSIKKWTISEGNSERNNSGRSEVCEEGSSREEDTIKVRVVGEQKEEGRTTKVLGVVWNAKMDYFEFKVKLNFSAKKRKMRVNPDLKITDLPDAFPTRLTKRMILSQVNGIYDPLGLAAPFTIKAKLLLRDLCSGEVKHLGWDDPVPEKAREDWIRFFMELFEMENTKFERCVKPKEAIGDPVLVLFSDGSEQAFGACAYARWKTLNQGYVSRLIMSKTRVAPLKKITVVRLELNGALVAKRLKSLIEAEMRLQFSKCYFIVDSQIVRAMLQKESYGFNTYVGVRVGEIQEGTSPEDWYWVDGKLNIADIITRGKGPSEIGPNSRWQQGPDFLKLNESEWPIRRECAVDLLPEQVKTVLTASVKEQNSISNIIHIERFSKYKRMMFVTARVLAVFRRDPKPSFRHIKNTPSTLEIENAERVWIKEAQDGMKEEMENKRYARLCPRIKDDGVIVVGGRMQEWIKVTYNEQEPILLPYSHGLSRLYVESIHRKGHLGVAATMSKVRLRFWIPRLAQLCKSIRSHCVTCRRLDKTTHNQVMGPLPMERLKPSAAWSHTSLDFFGPFEIRGEVNKRTRGKGYGVLFNCAFSRAVHVDIALDYSTEGLLLVLRRFLAIRGCPSKFRSDRGSQLVAASKEVKQMLESLELKRIEEFGVVNGFEWEFSSPDAPWQNGCSEALIKSIKRAIVISIGTQVLTATELQTVFFEAANLVNERPIGRHPQSADEGSYLCPNDLLLGRATSHIPTGNYSENANAKSRYHFVQQIVDSFNKKWKRDYFSTLIIRQKWHTRTRNVRVGDVVLVQDSNQIRGKWKLGKVSKADPGSDGMVRNVEIKYKCDGHKTFTTIERPVQKLVVVLPVDENDE